MTQNELFQMFMIVWVLLGVASAIFYWRASYEAKKKWHVPIVIFGSTLFLVFCVLLFRSASVLFFMVPAVGLITFLNIRFTKFCPRCGATLQQVPPWGTMDFCKKCGSPLKEQAHV